MSSRFVRASKVRHVFGEGAKPENMHTDLRLSTATGDHSYIKASTKFFAVASPGGGGPVLVLPLDKPGKIAPGVPTLAGHTAPVLDMDFNPFHDNMLATGSDDSTIKVWGIPDEGLTETLTEPLADLSGHGRKVTFVLWHPTASNVLASSSWDGTVKVWDAEACEAKLELSGFEQHVQDLKWNYDGSVLATSCKDKLVRMYDPRAQAETASVQAHEGSKASKVCFLGKRDMFATVGFTRESKRQLKFWDVRALDTPLKSMDIDTAAGVIFPFFDEDSNVLFLAGKGDGNIRYYEVVDEAPYAYPISDYRSTVSCKGITMLPKRSVDVGRVEIARFLKLTSNKRVEPISFICPRKADSFQADLYPPAYAGMPALSAAEWFSGSNADPVTASLDPGATSGSSPSSPTYKPLKSAAHLQKELDAAHARIKELEAELAALKGE
eukprot:CAMPEP_0196780620 /NCGR_PEP_ID=MMETSP1104-20130614/8206_1 /TAXON_ID=33652 /ORGANISM="Cafeteria sp., Strain Caron Lab Isolate" /LENGTH=438 /DNA_ID=CAMNT_0042150833 /DNA_START=33 /DNA_END=1349 /DNA_ORIENTATION=+